MGAVLVQLPSVKHGRMAAKANLRKVREIIRRPMQEYLRIYWGDELDDEDVIDICDSEDQNAVQKAQSIPDAEQNDTRKDTGTVGDYAWLVSPPHNHRHYWKKTGQEFPIPVGNGHPMPLKFLGAKCQDYNIFCVEKPQVGGKEHSNGDDDDNNDTQLNVMEKNPINGSDNKSVIEHLCCWNKGNRTVTGISELADSPSVVGGESTSETPVKVSSGSSGKREKAKKPQNTTKSKSVPPKWFRVLSRIMS